MDNFTSGHDILRILIGDKWKFLIICHLVNGPRQYNDLLRTIDSITKKVLTENLKSLEQYGIIVRNSYPGVVMKVEYSLTELGLSLKPIFLDIMKWANYYAESYRNKS